MKHLHFKTEGAHLLKDLLQKGDWMVSKGYISIGAGGTAVQTGPAVYVGRTRF